jgi:hypothetical protein
MVSKRRRQGKWQDAEIVLLSPLRA